MVKFSSLQQHSLVVCYFISVPLRQEFVTSFCFLKFMLSLIKEELRKLLLKHLLYILAHKSRNSWQNLTIIFSIHLNAGQT